MIVDQVTSWAQVADDAVFGVILLGMIGLVVLATRVFER